MSKILKKQDKKIVRMSVILWFVKLICIFALFFVFAKLNLKYYLAHFNCRDLRKERNDIIEYFVEENSDDLFSDFSEIIKEERDNLTKREIEYAFDFIEGDIISYDASSIGGTYKKKGMLKYYFDTWFYYTNVQTNANKTYSIYVNYVYLDKYNKDYEGIVKITICDNENDQNEITIGDLDYVDADP